MTGVLFLVAGFVLAEGVTGVPALGPGDEIVTGLVEPALFPVLYTDGMRVGLSDLRRLPGKAVRGDRRPHDDRGSIRRGSCRAGRRRTPRSV